MKIVLINNLFGEYARGGAERVVATIADGLVQAGHEVAVVSIQPLQFSIFLPDRCAAGGRGNFQFSIKIQILNTKYKILAFCPWNIISYYNLGKLPTALRFVWHLLDMFNVQSYFKIKKILRTEKPDLVMTHNLMGVGFLTPRAIKAAGVKRYFHTLHDIQLLHPSGLMMVGQEKKVDSLSARFYQWCNKKLFESVDVVISPSRWLLDEHVKRGFFKKTKQMTMANPITQKSENYGIASSLPTVAPRNDSGSFIFLYVGQIEKHKGVELLIDAFEDLIFSSLSFRARSNEGEKSIIDSSSQAPRNDKRRVELWIVGAKNYELQTLPTGRQVTNYKLKNIKFFGKKDNEEAQNLMRKSHCLVVPSLCYENQPTVVKEAQQNNLPVIASNIGGIPEILDAEFLFKAGDKESLKNKMQWVIDNYQEFKFDDKPLISVESYIEKLLSL
ncbi:MAG: glycosyltransferase [Methanoregula sp.]|jgi:glycosyltransferase involved in cell wall biosynthesis|nr:glycosyltransferase [Methanoregula sp.]